MNGMMDNDVQGTNDDASISRCSMVSAGYLEDIYAPLLIKKSQKIKRPPLINRGTYVRTVIIDNLLKDFLKTFDGSQVVSFGSGSDTRYLRLKVFLYFSRTVIFYIPKDQLSNSNCKYFEIDFPEVTAKKAMFLNKNKWLSDTARFTGCDVDSPQYSLISGDLRDFKNVVSKLQDRAFDLSKPTFFLSECTLIYIDPVISNQVFISYEMF